VSILQLAKRLLRESAAVLPSEELLWKMQLAHIVGLSEPGMNMGRVCVGPETAASMMI
jgi:hypothetical protein